MSINYNEKNLRIDINRDVFEKAWFNLQQAFEEHMKLVDDSIIKICDHSIRYLDNETTNLTPPTSRRRPRRFTSAQTAVQTLFKKYNERKNASNFKPFSRLGKSNLIKEKESNEHNKLETNDEPFPSSLVNNENFCLVDSVKKSPEESFKKQTPVEVEDNDWLTDDESFRVSDNVDSKSVNRTEDTSKADDECESILDHKKINQDKSRKRKKKTQYFTPSLPSKSTRITRARSRANSSPPQNKLLSTPLNKSNVRRPASVNNRKAPSLTSNSLQSNSSSTFNKALTAPSNNKIFSRTGNTPSSKCLTGSAIKRKQEEEEKRRIVLQQLQEREEKALLQKQAHLQQKISENKKKNEEKQKRIERAKELRERELEVRRQKEIEKQAEMEKRQKELEENKKLEQLKHQELLKKRQMVFEQRKKQEEEERKAKIQKQEELMRKKQEDAKKHKMEEDKIASLILQHNQGLHKAKDQHPFKLPIGNSFEVLKVPPKPEKILEKQIEVYNNLLQQESKIDADPKLNCTYEVKENKKIEFEVKSYQITPPPMVKTIDNYDITDIKSGDDTDDEERTKKPIANWAKGEQFVAGLSLQYKKSMKKREKEINTIFGVVELPIDLDVIFKGYKTVNSRYAKRTSSAVWTSPPTLNSSRIFSEASFHK